jgi:hypothetical protein
MLVADTNVLIQPLLYVAIGSGSWLRLQGIAPSSISTAAPAEWEHRC